MAILKTKAERASQHISAATELFTDAHDKLSKADGLLAEAEDEHREASTYHAEQAQLAKAERERSARVRTRIAELLS